MTDRQSSPSAQLLQFENHWETAMGAWFPGSRVVLRGRDLFTDFKDHRWIEQLLYTITGRDFAPDQCRLLEALWSMGASYPDPRLWVNRVGALAGTARSTAALGVGAAVAVSEATIYGLRPILRTLDTLMLLAEQLDGGADLNQWLRDWLARGQPISGYGRPITPVDERIAPIMALAQELGFAQGRHLQLAFALERALQQQGRKLRMNIAAVSAGIGADLGLSRREYYHFLVLSFSAGVMACYIDASSQPEGCFFPLRCESIRDNGRADRRWAHPDSGDTTTTEHC